MFCFRDYFVAKLTISMRYYKFLSSIFCFTEKIPSGQAALGDDVPRLNSNKTRNDESRKLSCSGQA
jgi:hypothetical protein